VDDAAHAGIAAAAAAATATATAAAAAAAPLEMTHVNGRLPAGGAPPPMGRMDD
jgi:hypothetical protein